MSDPSNTARSYEATQLPLLRLFNDGGVPPWLVSDREKAFMAIARDCQSRKEGWESQQIRIGCMDWTNERNEWT